MHFCSVCETYRTEWVGNTIMGRSKYKAISGQSINVAYVLCHKLQASGVF